MQHCKDPAVVGQYDKLLAYVDSKAESFFALHGFSDDPILTTLLRWCGAPLSHSLLLSLSLPLSHIGGVCFPPSLPGGVFPSLPPSLIGCVMGRKKADPWENSILMVYTPPFSGDHILSASMSAYVGQPSVVVGNRLIDDSCMQHLHHTQGNITACTATSWCMTELT